MAFAATGRRCDHAHDMAFRFARLSMAGWNAVQFWTIRS